MRTIARRRPPPILRARHQPLRSADLFPLQPVRTPLRGRAPTAASTGPLTCRSAEGDGKLTPIAEFVSFFKSLKDQPEQVLVSVLAGPPTPYVVRSNGGEAEITPSCQSAAGPAAPAVRLAEFAAGFGMRGFFSSVCDADLGPALERFGTAIGRQLGASCLTAAPVKTRADAGDGAPDCRVTQKPADLGPERELPHCTATGPRPCWSLSAGQDRCESGVEMRIDAGETGFLPGTVINALCRVCTARTDARCR